MKAGTDKGQAGEGRQQNAHRSVSAMMLPADRGAQDCPRWFEQKNEHLSTPVPPVTFKAPSDWTRESIPPCSSLQLHTALLPSAVSGIRAEHQQPPWYQPMGKLSSTNRALEDFPATKEGNTTLMTQRPRRHVAQQSRKSITITMSMIHHHHCHHQSCPDSPITPPTTTLTINPVMLKWSHHHNITTATNHVKSASLPTSSIMSHQSHHNSTVTIDHISPAPSPTSPPLIPISTINIGTSLPPPVITIITTNTITSVPSVMPHRHYRHITTTAPSIISPLPSPQLAQPEPQLHHPHNHHLPPPSAPPQHLHNHHGHH